MSKLLQGEMLLKEQNLINVPERTYLVSYSALHQTSVSELKEMIAFHAHFSLPEISMLCMRPYLENLLEFQCWTNKLEASLCFLKKRKFEKDWCI